MHQLTLEQFRTTAATGAVLSVTLRAQGAKFYVQAETRRGEATLITKRGKAPRGFANPIKALALLRELGILESRVETTDWRPEEAEMDKRARPDRAESMPRAALLDQWINERYASSLTAKAVPLAKALKRTGYVWP